MKTSRKGKSLPRLIFALRLSVMQRLGTAAKAGNPCTLAGLIAEYRGAYTATQVREAVEQLVDLDHATVFPAPQSGQVLVGLSRRMRGASR
ncbi:MAG: hypothetical protein ACO1SX_21895 [Actinomycetota bacterium]